MNRLIDWIKSEWPSLIVVISGVLLQVFLATRSFQFLIQTIFPDDAFFYFQIARNIAHGLGSSLDGIHITNGYHPLWMLLLVPVFKYIVSPFPDLAPIRAALFIQIALNLLTALIVVCILSRFTKNKWVKGFGMIAWVLNPFLLYETLNGLETSLALFLFVLFALLALRIEERGAKDGYWLIGFVGGLLILARLDMSLYVVAFLGWILIRRGWKDGWPSAVLFSVCAAIPLIPWLIWNFITFGMLLTSSSGGEALLNHAAVQYAHGTSWFQFLKATIYASQSAAADMFVRTGMYALGAAFLGAFAVLVAYKEIPIPKKLRDIPMLAALFCGCILLFIGNASIRWVDREWYFVTFDLFFIIIIVLVLERVLRHVSFPRVAGIVLTLLMLFSFYVDWSKYLSIGKTEDTYQSSLPVVADWLNTNLPVNATIGVVTPGILSYLSNAHIVDLDGLVNNSAYKAMQEHKVWAYIEQNVTYLCIYDRDVANDDNGLLGITDPFAHLTLVAEIPGGGGFKVYKVK